MTENAARFPHIINIDRRGGLSDFSRVPGEDGRSRAVSSIPQMKADLRFRERAVEEEPWTYEKCLRQKRLRV